MVRLESIPMRTLTSYEKFRVTSSPNCKFLDCERKPRETQWDHRSSAHRASTEPTVLEVKGKSANHWAAATPTITATDAKNENCNESIQNGTKQQTCWIGSLVSDDPQMGEARKYWDTWQKFTLKLHHQTSVMVQEPCPHLSPPPQTQSGLPPCLWHFFHQTSLLVFTCSCRQSRYLENPIFEFAEWEVHFSEHRCLESTSKILYQTLCPAMTSSTCLSPNALYLSFLYSSASLASLPTQLSCSSSVVLAWSLSRLWTSFFFPLFICFLRFHFLLQSPWLSEGAGSCLCLCLPRPLLLARLLFPFSPLPVFFLQT